MVTLTKNKLIIEMEHSCPEELLAKLKSSIVLVVQNINYEIVGADKMSHAQFFILEVLQALMIDEENQKYNMDEDKYEENESNI